MAQRDAGVRAWPGSLFVSTARSRQALVALGLLLVGCSPTATSTATPPAATQGLEPPHLAPAPNVPGDPENGRRLLIAKGCGGCHTVPGVAGANGKIGPDLAGVGSRPTLAGGAVPHNGPDDIKRWILDPPALKPGTAMPKLGLSDDEATRIAAYLETLK
jgi:cytochrome c2